MIFYEESEKMRSGSRQYLSKNSRTIQKIANFLLTQAIPISEFWQTNRNYISAEDIDLFCQIIGLKLSAQDMINLKSQLFFEKEVISIYDFSKLIPYWKDDSEDVVGEFLKQRSDNLLDNLQSKNKLSRNGSAKSRSRPYSYNKTRNTSNNKENRIFRPNNSKKYLESFKERAKQKEQELAEAIQRTKNEYEYSMLLKMNEINEINRKNKSSITYRAYKNAEGSINVRVFDYEVLKKQITLKEFESEYKVFMKSSKQNKQWQRRSYKSKGPSMLNTKSNNVGVMRKNQKKEQRQKELKNLLENTVKLTQLLQQQIKIFKARGIYGTEAYNI